MNTIYCTIKIAHRYYVTYTMFVFTLGANFCIKYTKWWTPCSIYIFSLGIYTLKYYSFYYWQQLLYNCCFKLFDCFFYWYDHVSMYQASRYMSKIVGFFGFTSTQAIAITWFSLCAKNENLDYRKLENAQLATFLNKL